MKKRLITIILLVINLTLQAQEVPFRAEMTYKLELGMEYKKNPITSTSVVKPGEANIRDTGFDFYLLLKLELLQLLEDDLKLKIINEQGDVVLSKKLKKLELFTIDIGSSPDIKSGKVSQKYRMEFINAAKELSSIILIEFTDEGKFFVNNKPFGQI